MILTTAMIGIVTLEISLLLTVCLGAEQIPPAPPTRLQNEFTFSGDNNLCLSNNCASQPLKKRSVLDCSRQCISSDCVGFYFEKNAGNCMLLTRQCIIECPSDGTPRRMYMMKRGPCPSQTKCGIEGTGCSCLRNTSQGDEVNSPNLLNTQSDASGMDAG